MHMIAADDNSASAVAHPTQSSSAGKITQWAKAKATIPQGYKTEAEAMIAPGPITIA